MLIDPLVVWETFSTSMQKFCSTQTRWLNPPFYWRDILLSTVQSASHCRSRCIIHTSETKRYLSSDDKHHTRHAIFLHTPVGVMPKILQIATFRCFVQLEDGFIEWRLDRGTFRIEKKPNGGIIKSSVDSFFVSLHPLDEEETKQLNF